MIEFGNSVIQKQLESALNEQNLTLTIHGNCPVVLIMDHKQEIMSLSYQKNTQCFFLEYLTSSSVESSAVRDLDSECVKISISNHSNDELRVVTVTFQAATIIPDEINSILQRHQPLTSNSKNFNIVNFVSFAHAKLPLLANKEEEKIPVVNLEELGEFEFRENLG